PRPFPWRTRAEARLPARQGHQAHFPPAQTAPACQPGLAAASRRRPGIAKTGTDEPLFDGNGGETMARGEQFRPEAEALTDRRVPAWVAQRFDGVLDIDGGFCSDDVHAFYDRFGNVVVNARGFIDVFDGATVTGIEFYGYRGNDRFVNDTAVACYANGGVGHDYLEGGGGDDVLVGGFG